MKAALMNRFLPKTRHYLVLALAFCLIGPRAFAYEIIEKGSTPVEISANGFKTTLGDVQYVLVSARAAALLVCDHDPDDPICETDGFFYEKSVFPLVEEMRRQGYEDSFRSRFTIPELTKAGMRESEMVSGMVVFVKGSAPADVRDKIIDTLVQKHL